MDIQSIEDLVSDSNITLVINYKGKINHGIAVLYPSWSVVQRFLTVLLDQLKIKPKKFTLYFFDVDNDICRAFESTYGVQSQGKCEMYLFKDSMIVDEIKVHDRINPEIEIERMLSMSNQKLI